VQASGQRDVEAEHEDRLLCRFGEVEASHQNEAAESCARSENVTNRTTPDRRRCPRSMRARRRKYAAPIVRAERRSGRPSSNKTSDRKPSGLSDLERALF
jgi:hypothetical protein